MYPIITLSITGLLLLFLGLSKNQTRVLPFQIFSLLLALGSIYVDYNSPGLYFNDMLEVNNSVLLIQGILILTCLLISLLSPKQFSEIGSHHAEYYALMQLSLVGALIMVGFQNFFMLFVGLEILSVGLYILTGTDKRNLRGNEAAVKYFLMGAFATGILLFGIAMHYGATGSFHIDSGAAVSGLAPEMKVFFYLGIFFISIGLLFKVSAAPFHFWTADVYQGAPSIFTSFMASVVKTAGIIAIYRVFAHTFAAEYDKWSQYLVIIIALTLFVGNLSAFVQDSFKRTLAFSSISQAGFLLLSIIGIGVKSEGNLAFYALSYSLATVCAFGVFFTVNANQIENGRPSESISVFNGLFKKNPFLAVVLIISMLSMAGIPLTSGFWSKFFVLNDAASRGFFWILILGVTLSALSLYYYFKPIRASFAGSSNESDIELSGMAKFALGLAAGASVLLGLVPSLFRDLFV
jgi:NADH-quinone oxidoreductase subunit N